MEVYVDTPEGKFRWNHITIIPRIGELVSVVIDDNTFTSSGGMVRDVRYDQCGDGSLIVTIYIGDDND